MQVSPTSLEGAVASGKIKATSGNLRYNDLKPDSVISTNSTDTTEPLIKSLEGKVNDPVAVASMLQQSGSEEEAKKQLAEAGIIDEGEQASILPYILGSAVAGAGGLAYALSKRKKKPQPEIKGTKNSPAHKPGDNGSSNGKQPLTVDGGELKAVRTKQATPLALPVPQKQIGTDIMSEEKVISELKRIMMNMASIGKRKGKIK